MQVSKGPVHSGLTRTETDANVHTVKCDVCLLHGSSNPDNVTADNATQACRQAKERYPLGQWVQQIQQ